jgi:hypothetical protein
VSRFPRGAVHAALPLRKQRSKLGGVGSAKLLGLGSAMPNPSVNLTRYGMQRKPGPRPLRHHRVPGLRCTPPRAGYLTR